MTFASTSLVVVYTLLNKTRGLRRWPTRETIVLRCNKFNTGSTEIFEFQARNSELFWNKCTNVPVMCP